MFKRSMVAMDGRFISLIQGRLLVRHDMAELITHRKGSVRRPYTNGFTAAWMYMQSCMANHRSWIGSSTRNDSMSMMVTTGNQKRRYATKTRNRDLPSRSSSGLMLAITEVYETMDRRLSERDDWRIPESDPR